MTSDQDLRSDRLVFYEQDVERLEGELDAFLEMSNAKCAMLIDKEGHLVTRRGEPLNTSLDSISALIAGSFAATKEMARLLGEEEFSILFHQGVRDSIQLQLVGNRTLLAILFDDRTNLGLVRFYAQETARTLSEIFDDIRDRPAVEGGPVLSQDFSADAAAALDDLF
jgi:predicted regulator of Ras-like GTPase activity (Roadblock/LC7/MglB family)